jgi:hypothetical protein
VLLASLVAQDIVALFSVIPDVETPDIVGGVVSPKGSVVKVRSLLVPVLLLESVERTW